MSIGKAEKKDSEEETAGIFLEDHSLRAPSFTFTRDSSRWVAAGSQGKRRLGVLTTDADRSPRAKCAVSEGEENLFSNHIRYNGERGVAFNAPRKRDMISITLEATFETYQVLAVIDTRYARGEAKNLN